MQTGLIPFFIFVNFRQPEKKGFCYEITVMKNKVKD